VRTSGEKQWPQMKAEDRRMAAKKHKKHKRKPRQESVV
jgi:hypothetical protein